MSIIFTDYFDAVPAGLTGWGSPDTLVVTSYFGDEGTNCVACSNNQSRKTFPTTYDAQGAIRAQVACILTTVGLPDGALTFGVQDFHGGALGDPFQFLVYLRSDGAFRIRRNNGFGSGGLFHVTAPGLFPVDGTQFGLQIRFSVGASNSVIFEVNNVDVATISWNHTHEFGNHWDDVWIYGRTDGVYGALTAAVTVDNYEVDDSNASVDWPAGNAPQLDLELLCLAGPAPADPPCVNGLNWIAIRVNGDDDRIVAKQQVPSLTAHLTTTQLLHLEPGDYVEVLVFQDSGADVDMRLLGFQAIRVAP